MAWPPGAMPLAHLSRLARHFARRSHAAAATTTSPAAADKPGVTSGAAALLFANLPPGTPPVQAYESLVESGKISPDENQRLALQPLQRLHQDLAEYVEGKASGATTTGDEGGGGGGGLFGKLGSMFGGASKGASSGPTSTNTPRGVYLQGGVGTGKSFCMDLFFNVQPAELKKTRVHFHDFMAKVHLELHARKHLPDPLPDVARDMKSKAKLLCFDEFQVTDVADAMILRRLLEALRSCGCVCVFTSNRVPRELYKNGLNRASFVPAIDLIEQTNDVFCFDASAIDYRLTGTLGNSAGGSGPWFVDGDGGDVGNTFDRFWEKKLCKDQGETSSALIALGRRMNLPRVSKDGGSVRFTFDELFGQPLGASDYGRLSGQHHTIMIEDVPRLNADNLDKLRRFITGIDVFYERKAKLIILAAAPVLELFDSTGLENRDESFAWDRTVSRLTEMQTQEYMRAPWQPTSITEAEKKEEEQEEESRERIKRSKSLGGHEVKQW